MSCIVTQKKVQDLVKNKIKDKFTSIKFMQYQDRAVGFIPYDADNPSKNVLYGKVKNLESRLNKEFGANQYGAVVSFNQKVNGVEFNIHPSIKLAEAMTQQNADDEIHSSRYQVQQELDEELQTSQKPIGNNYVAFVGYKQKQLEEKEAKRKRLRGIDTVKSRAELKELNKEIIYISNQLELLADNQVDYMFHAIIEDLDNIDIALKDNDIHKVEDVKQALDYYSEFVKDLISYKHSDFNEIAGKIITLLNSYDKLLDDKVIKQLEENIFIQDLIDNENIDRKDKEEDLLQVEDLLTAESDISWTDKTYLGLISSNTNETILPQFLMAEFRAKLYKNQSDVIALIDKLNSFTKRTGMKNFDWVFSKDEKGEIDGYLIDVFSKSWYEEFRNRNTKLKQFTDSLFSNNIDTKTTYINLINWYKNNTNLIDFTKLRAVKDIYENIYSEHFTHTDKEIDAYEENIKKQLGPRYNEVISQVLNKLQKFEELKESDSEYKERNLAAHDIWQFLEEYKKGTPSQMNYTYGEDNKHGKVYFSAFNDLAILPKSKIVKTIVTDTGVISEEKDSGFYSKEFQDILGDKNKIEYWGIIKEMSDYINSTYNLEHQSRLSYPKIKTAFNERMLESIKSIRTNTKAFGIVGKQFMRIMHEYKSFFYQQTNNRVQEGVVSNYSDASKSEIYKLAKIYRLKGIPKDEAYERATTEVLKNYSTDVNTLFKAMVLEAAVHETRLDIVPMTKGVLNKFKKIRNKSGDIIDNKNSMERLEYYVSKIILNQSEEQRGSSKMDKSKKSKLSIISKVLIKFFGDKINNITKIRLLDEVEKKLFKELEDLQKIGYSEEFDTNDLEYSLQRILDTNTNEYIYKYNGDVITEKEFKGHFNKYIEDEKRKLGLKVSVAGLIDGVLKSVIYSSLSLNFVSGIYNRVEGKHSSMIMDLTGKYWTKGNIDKANEIMAFANLKKILASRLSIKFKKRKQTIEIFDLLLSRLGTLQDRKNELQRNVDSSEFNAESLNLFKWAVDMPEFKNQGSIILALMIDTKIKDNQGIEHSLLDEKTKEFTPFDIIDGVLKIKPEFENSFSLQGNEMIKLISKIEDTVSHSQGNYNRYDIMLAKGDIYGRAYTLFMTWFPEQMNQRFGTGGEDNYNLFTGKKRGDGRFVAALKANKLNFLAYVVAVLGISYGAIGTVGLIGGGLVAAYVYNSFIKKITTKKSIERDINYAKEMVEFLQSTLIETLSYPSRIGSSIPILNKIRFKNNTFENKDLSPEEIGSMQAMTRELAIMLTGLVVKFAMASLLFKDDDDEEYKRRKYHNFVQNQLNKYINSLALYSNPAALVSDNSRFAALQYLKSLEVFLEQIFYDYRPENLKDNFLKLTPISKMITKALKGEAPWEDNKDYSESSENGFIKPLKWTTDVFKDKVTGGEHSAQKEYKKLTDEKRKEIKDELIDEYGNDKKKLKKKVDKKMQSKFPRKKKEETYKHLLEKAESEEESSE